jgi:hypothetical protein
VQVIAVGTVTDRTLNVGYYASSNWPIDVTDWTGADNPGSDAGTFALTGFSASTQKDMALSSPASVSLTGYTGLRMGISGAAPAVNNDNYLVEMATLDHASLTEPQLIVTYEKSVSPDVSGFPKPLLGERVPV